MSFPSHRRIALCRSAEVLLDCRRTEVSLEGCVFLCVLCLHRWHPRFDDEMLVRQSYFSRRLFLNSGFGLPGDNTRSLWRNKPDSFSLAPPLSPSPGNRFTECVFFTQCHALPSAVWPHLAPWRGGFGRAWPMGQGHGAGGLYFCPPILSQLSAKRGSGLEQGSGLMWSVPG